MQPPIYLDYNATTPLAAPVIEAMRPFLEQHFGNPSSSHWYGFETRQAVELARQQVADLLGCEPEEIIFTSGGSESNNYAIKGFALANRSKGTHIITSQIEHPAVTEVCKFLEQNGFQVTYLQVDENGVINVNALEKAISPQTILVSLMHANNEVGTIQPIAEIAEIAHKHGIPLHTDAAQSVGKIPVQVNELGADLLTVAGHKIYAPKGVGALYVRQGVTLEKQIHGADHESNLRAGTENVLEIVGLGKACELAQKDFKQNSAHMRHTRDLLYQGILAKCHRVKLNGHPKNRLPNTLSISFPGIEANTLLDELDGLAASAGAACHSDSIDISPTLLAMGVPVEYAMGTIRLSTGRFLTENDVEKAVSIITAAVNRLQPNAEHELAPAGNKVGEIKLTHFTHGLGCACKLRPQALERILADMPVPDDARVLVGLNTADDAAVYKINQDTAIVQTVDFFTPIHDDPYQFGAIAATNALSDIYAMGGKPLFALNIVGFPSNRLPMEVLGDILRGAQDKAKEAGLSIIGGHTIEDTEPKFGLAVTGIVHPDKIWTNNGAKPGDALILTKPIGLGIISTAIKRGLAKPETTVTATALMATLNRAAAEVLADFSVHACTDITGFGLLGHLKEMTIGSGVEAEIIAEKVPVLTQAKELVAAKIIPGGTLNNLDYIADMVDWASDVSHTMRTLLCDAQTSGGLLIALPEKEAVDAVLKLQQNGVAQAARIGCISKSGKGKIQVIKA